MRGVRPLPIWLDGPAPERKGRFAGGRSFHVPWYNIKVYLPAAFAIKYDESVS